MLITGFLTAEWTGDRRVNGWFLMSNPFPTIACSILYFCAVSVGVHFMRQRPPFQLRRCLIVYNVLLVVLSTWIVVDGGRFGWFGHYNFTCAECDTSENELNAGMVRIVHVYYLSKFVEMMDTIFFVLRKKNSLLTKLHLIHHGLLPISCWFTVKYVPVGHATFMGFINSLVHVVMYAYYALAAANVHGRVFALLKQSITKLQMLQFVLMIVHSAQTLVNGCHIPKWIAYSNIGHGLLFLTLFANFYHSRYNCVVEKKELNSESQRNMHINPHFHGA